ncbi:hypothetical protein ACIQGT_29830 [Streptomyces sp. NPDC093108]|uniref:hypothetical protein n=1 Tax=unclassified Streptomyces TaxID=2593676 RepID=UPI00382B07AA
MNIASPYGVRARGIGKSAGSRSAKATVHPAPASARAAMSRLSPRTAMSITRRAQRRPPRPAKSYLPDHASRGHRPVAQGRAVFAD